VQLISHQTSDCCLLTSDRLLLHHSSTILNDCLTDLQNPKPARRLKSSHPVTGNMNDGTINPALLQCHSIPFGTPSPATYSKADDWSKSQNPRPVRATIHPPMRSKGSKQCSPYSIYIEYSSSQQLGKVKGSFRTSTEFVSDY
jgi:hypothetical protein